MSSAVRWSVARRCLAAGATWRRPRTRTAAANPFGTRRAGAERPAHPAAGQGHRHGHLAGDPAAGRERRAGPAEELPTKAGWYADGTAPGDTGPAVLAGHVDSKRGPAVFYRLREVDHRRPDRGDPRRQTVRFTVTSTAWYPKNGVPDRARSTARRRTGSCG